MPADNINQNLSIKRIKSRYIVINENIHEALGLHTLSLYMAFRYEADYTQEDSVIKRSAKFLYEKAKISRAQYYCSLNKLEKQGLVLRDAGNGLGGVCLFHVAQDLHYFTRGVQELEGGVQEMDTDHYSLSLKDNTNSESKDSSLIVSKPKKKPKTELMPLIDAYREIFPDNPQPHKRVISTSLSKTLGALVKRWPELDPDGKPLTVEAFSRYLSLLKGSCPQFALGEYVTKDGNRKKNNLETFSRWNTVVKFLENAYS